MLSPQETICAVASAAGGAARGIVRISGPAVAAVLDHCFRPHEGASSLGDITSAQVISGTMHLGDQLGEIAGDLYYWPTSRSYTRQPVAEFHTFGSPPLLAAVVRVCCRHGARPAEPGEFTLRAFLAGRIDLTQAEAVLGVIDAAGSKPLQTALAQLAGGLSRPLGALRERLLSLLAHLEAGLDFVEEDIEFISSEVLCTELAHAATAVETLLGQVRTRTTQNDAPRIVLHGAPNAGKSSLFNVLVGSPAALVSEVEGTTRDYLTARIEIGGILCELIDTAGISAAVEQHPIEVAAQSASLEQREAAQISILCLDSSKPCNPGGSACSTAAIVVLTKSDQPRQCLYDGPAITTSSRSGVGITDLRAAIHRLLVSQRQDAVAGTAERCYDSLLSAHAAIERAKVLAENRCGEELVAAELRAALEELGKVVGAVYTDDILDRIFSRFCIGK